MTTPLAEKLRARIAADGPMSVADFMAACLGDPEHGYYLHRDPFGAAGDFITAPEISQMFGELIGLWAVAVWIEMGEPSRFVLAELGPGRGTLMADALRAARIRPAFLAAADIVLVETSPRLRAAQRQTLAGLASPTFAERVEDIPSGPAIIIANEFFDALPIRQFVRTDASWAERMVGLGPDGALAFGLRPCAPPPLPFSPPATEPSHLPRHSAAPLLPLEGGGREGVRPTVSVGAGPRAAVPGPPPGLPLLGGGEDGGERAGGRPHAGEEWRPPENRDPFPIGAVLELRPAADAIIATLAARLAASGGTALIIDYGHAETAPGDTLQAVAAHRYADPLAAPGAADLTAHVDFAALAAAATAAGANATPIVTQGAFLDALGLRQRAAALAAGKPAAETDAIHAAADRLAGEGAAAMGTLFKVMAITAPGLAVPGFRP